VLSSFVTIMPWPSQSTVLPLVESVKDFIRRLAKRRTPFLFKNVSEIDLLTS
jgi:hypothetical protein